MFRILIKKVINILDFVLSELKRAYEETYGLSDLSKEFNKKVEEIRKENKKSFLRAAEMIEFQKSIFSLEFAPMEKIKKRANDKWLEAMSKGDLDELYNVRERSKNE